LIVVVSLTAVAASADDVSEEAVKLTDCPKAVQKTLKRESRGGKIVEIEKEVEDGETIYEAEVMIDGKEYDIEIASDGTLLSKELEDEEEDSDDDEDGTQEASAEEQPQPGRGRGYRWRGGRGPGHGGGPGPGRGYGRGRGQGHGGGMGGDPQFQKDRDMFHFLLANRDSIDRKVKKLEDGVETVTESDDPKVAAVIRDHVESMYKRVESGNPIHMRDPLFAAIFRNADKISMKVERTKKGVRVTETSSDPYVAKLIQAHADVVNLFVANGHVEVRENHAVPER
jgi:hypothetical protein